MNDTFKVKLNCKKHGHFKDIIFMDRNGIMGWYIKCDCGETETRVPKGWDNEPRPRRTRELRLVGQEIYLQLCKLGFLKEEIVRPTQETPTLNKKIKNWLIHGYFEE